MIDANGLRLPAKPKPRSRKLAHPSALRRQERDPVALGQPRNPRVVRISFTRNSLNILLLPYRNDSVTVLQENKKANYSRGNLRPEVGMSYPSHPLRRSDIAQVHQAWCDSASKNPTVRSRSQRVGLICASVLDGGSNSHPASKSHHRAPFGD